MVNYRSLVEALSALPLDTLHSCASDATSGYLRSAFSSRNSIQLLRNALPLEDGRVSPKRGKMGEESTHLFTVSESPMTVSERFGRVIATVSKRTSATHCLSHHVTVTHT